MSVLPLFCLLAAALSALLLFTGALPLWGALLAGLGLYLLLHPLYLLFLYCFSLPIDREKPLDRPVPLCWDGAVRVLGALCSYAGLRGRLEGADKLPQDGRFLFVCNHRSLFDPCLSVKLLHPWRVAFIAKPSILKIPVIGRIAYAAGFLPIDRENNRNALKTILQAADYLKRDLCSMGIYPEGTRTRSGELLPFHAGSFKIAQRAGVPVAVAVIRGTEQVRKNFPLRRTRATLEILELIDAERVKTMSTNELSDYSRERILAALDREARP